VSEASIHLAISSELCQVKFLGAAVRAVLGELSYPEERASVIELCLVEAVNNVIEHAYRDEPGRPVGVRITANASHIEVVVSDIGGTMPAGELDRARHRMAAAEDPATLELSEVAEGGYGLGLILQLMDHVAYHHDATLGRNFLTMSLQLVPAEAAGVAAKTARTLSQRLPAERQ
jgi:serine/threonine-protein kinase RsbW